MNAGTAAPFWVVRRKAWASSADHAWLPGRQFGKPCHVATDQFLASGTSQGGAQDLAHHVNLPQ
ncbi:MAG TPA: hypothetical protein VGH53_29430 [Streptosporangiaceae bacterium]